MTVFNIKAKNPSTGELKDFFYDNINSKLTDSSGADVVEKSSLRPSQSKAFVTSKDTPAGKSKDIKVLKIQLGLSCNYECTYCNQRFVPHASETNPDSIEPFLEQLPRWFDGGPSGDGSGIKLEFWGGEPFVYWKTLKPLAERLRQMYPNIQFTMITNGSLLDVEKNKWLDELGFSVGVSHDGPGHHVRGADPLDIPEQKEAILDLWKRLGTKGRMSINSMIHAGNNSRAAIEEFFNEKLGFVPVIGEGNFLDPYDEGGASVCFSDQYDLVNYRLASFAEIRAGKGASFQTVHAKINDFIQSIANARDAHVLGQRCGMDREDNIAVDLNGNVVTCQNVSPISHGMNGESHLLGHVSDFENIKLKTSTHWSLRDECPSCPVLQICKGSCMFLHGKLWELGCDNAYADNVPYFMAAIEIMTGFIPYYIDGPLPESRKDLIGEIHGIPERKKAFPIPVVSA